MLIYRGSVLPTATRGLRHVARHGPVETLRKVTGRARQLLYLHEKHVWSTLDLGDPRPHLTLPDGFHMFRAGEAEVPLVRQLDVDVDRSRRRLAEGAELWLIQHGAEVVYSGWIFHDYAPTIAAPGGFIALPSGMVNPEDMVTAAAYRGRGLASAGYSLMFDELERSKRATRIIGKVPADNGANRRALVKSGWREFAVVDFRRIGPWRQTRVGPIPAGTGIPATTTAALTEWLRGAMAAGRTDE